MTTFQDNSLHRFPTEGKNVTVHQERNPNQWAVEAIWKSGELEQIGPEEYKVISRYAYWERTYGSLRSGINHFKKGTILRTKNYQ